MKKWQSGTRLLTSAATTALYLPTAAPYAGICFEINL